MVNFPNGRWRSLKLADSDLIIGYTAALVAIATVQHLSGVFTEDGLGALRFRTLFETNTGELLALAAMWVVAKSKGRPIAFTNSDFLVLGACSLLLVPPEPHNSSFVGATLAGIYFWRRGRANPKLSSLGQLLVALASYEAWGRVLFRIVSVPVIRAETLAVGKVGQLLGFSLTVDGALFRSPNGWSIYILDACSSFHNVSLAVLVWLSLLKLGGAEVSRAKLSALGVGAALIVCLNVLRILLMTPSETDYIFWHQGNGATLFSCLAMAAIAFPTLISMRQDEKRNVSALA